MGFDDFDDVEVGLENTGNKTQEVIDDFDDVEVELENVQSDVKQTISVGEQLGVTFNKVSDIIKGTTEDFDEFEESVEDACETAANGLEKVTDAAAGTGNAVSKIKDDFEGIEEAIRNMPPEELEEITGATQDASVAAAEYNDNLKETVKLQNEVKETKTDFTQFDFSDLSAELKDTKENYDSLQKSVIDFSKIDFSSLTETAKRVSDVDYSQIDFSHMTEEYKEAKELFSETDEFEDFLNNLSTDELKELADNIDALNGKKAALNDDFDDVEVEIENVSDGIKDVNSNLKETVKLKEQLEGSRPFSIEDGFEDTDAEIENASKGVEEIKNSVADVSDVFDDVDTGAAGVSSEVENISTGIEDLNNDLKETVKLKDQLEESSSFSIDNSFDDVTEDDIKKANERYAERKAKEAKAAEDAAAAAASKKFPEILDRINNAKSESSNRDEFQAKFEESARPLINEFGKYLSGDQNATLQKAYQDAAQSTLEKEIAKAEKNKEVLEELRAAQKEEEEIAKRLEAHRFEDSLISNTKYLGNSLAEEPKTKPEAIKRNNEIAEYYNALKKLTEDSRFESFKDQGSYLNALVALEKAEPIAEKTNRLNAYLDQLKGLNEQIKSGDPKAAELKDSWSKLTEAFDNLDEVTKEKLKYGLKSVTNKISVIAKEELRTTINDQKSTLVGNAMTETPEDRYKALNDAKAAIDAESKKLKESGLLSESEIKGQTSSFLTKLEEQLSITVGRIIKSTFSGNLEEAAKVIEALGDKEKVDKLDVSDTVKDILTSAKPGSKIAGLIKKIYTEQTIDALKAEATVKEGDFKRSGSRRDAELALEAYKNLYAEMESAPEDVVSETDKANVQNKMKNLEDTIEDLYHAVTDEIDELTKDVSKTISNIKQDRTLSTKEKIDAVQGQLGRLEDATPVSTGDVKALEDSKDATQRALNNLQAQYADEQTRAAKQATQQVLSSVKSIVSGIERAMNTVVSIIRRGLSLLNRAINFTINSLKSVITGAQKIIQLVGSLSNRVRSFVGNLLNANKAGERSNVIVRSVGLTFTELNSILSLAERGFNALFNNQMLERALKFDSTIASITMLLGKEAVQDVREFAGALEKGFGIPATKTISDLQEISSLLKGVGLETKYIANASEDLYSMANYMAALGMANGDVSEAMSKLQSGMKGMTNSIDDLGISMRKDVLNEFLKNKGVDVKFSNLSETNRDIVRLASIIEQFKRGFDIKDYPTLLGQTYFRISLIKSQVEQIGTLLGKLWEGIIAKILPYIMKVVAVIKQGILSIAEFLHIDMDGKQIEENIESVANATDDVTKATEKAKKAQDKWTSTAGFDQLESLNSSKSGSGENDQDLSWLLDDVGNISDMLQKLAEDSEGFMDQLNKEIEEKLAEIKAKIQEFVDSLLGHHVDLSFGFDKKRASRTVKDIWKNVKRWWESFSRTGLYLGLRFAEDFQIGRFVNDVLEFTESLTRIVAVIQEQLEPVIKNFYDKYISPYVVKAGNKIHKLQMDFWRFSKVFEEIFDPNVDDATLQKHIDRLKEYSKTFGNLADKINIVKKNWKGFKDIWKGNETAESKTLRETIPLITELEDTIKSIRDLLSTLWGNYIKPLLDKVNGALPTPTEALQGIQDILDSITSYLSSDTGQITIKDSASDVLDIIQTKVDAIKSSLEAAGKIVLALITPTDKNGKVTSEAEGGTSVLSLLADNNRDFYENEFKPWIEGISEDISNFITEHKDDISKLIADIRDFAWERFKTVVEEIIKTIKWAVENEATINKVLDAIGTAFDFLVQNWEALVAVFGALAALKAIAGISNDVNSVLTLINTLKGTNNEGGTGGTGDTGSTGTDNKVKDRVSTGIAVIENVGAMGEVIKDAASGESTIASGRKSVAVGTGTLIGGIVAGPGGAAVGGGIGNVYASTTSALGVDKFYDKLAEQRVENDKNMGTVAAFAANWLSPVAVIQTAGDIVKDAIEDTKKEVTVSLDGTKGGYYQAQQYAKNIKIKGFASGGSISKGNLFIANENGTATELIGNITRKSGTDVANNKMITDAMETAVYNGFADAFNQMQSNNGVGSRQQQTINISGFGMIDKNTLKKLAQLLAPYLDANDKSLITT